MFDVVEPEIKLVDIRLRLASELDASINNDAHHADTLLSK
jgi:hypothetical protein